MGACRDAELGVEITGLCDGLGWKGKSHGRRDEGGAGEEAGDRGAWFGCIPEIRSEHQEAQITCGISLPSSWSTGGCHPTVLAVFSAVTYGPFLIKGPKCVNG